MAPAFPQHAASMRAQMPLEICTMDHDRAGTRRILRYPWTVDRSIELTAVYEPVEDGWVQARIVQLPGVITAAPSLEEAKDALVDALREYLLALGSESPSLDVATDAIAEPLELTLAP